MTALLTVIVTANSISEIVIVKTTCTIVMVIGRILGAINVHGISVFTKGRIIVALSTVGTAVEINVIIPIFIIAKTSVE